MWPSKGVAEGSVLASFELLKTNHILGEQIFIFKGQTNIVQTCVVCADSNINPSLEAAIEDRFELMNRLQSTCL